MTTLRAVVIALVVGLAVGLLSVACGGEKKESAVPSPKPAAAPAATPAPAPLSIPAPTVAPAPAAKPVLTFAEERAKVVQYLRQTNQASNNFEDAFTAAAIADKLASGDLLQINAALTAVTQQIAGYLRQVNDIPAPSEISDLAEFKATELRSVAQLQQAIQALRSAIQAGSEADILRAAQRVVQIGADPDTKRTVELVQGLLAKFNVPDSEVNYRRPKAP